LQQAIALGMRGDGFLAYAAGIDQLLHDRMVARAMDDASLPDQVEATVADVHPVRLAVLHQAGDQYRARRVGQAALLGFPQNRHVSRADGAREERAGVDDARPRLALERRAKEVDRHPGGDLAVEVPAEPV